jgi:hypothetical protein
MGHASRESAGKKDHSRSDIRHALSLVREDTNKAGVFLTTDDEESFSTALPDVKRREDEGRGGECNGFGYGISRDPVRFLDRAKHVDHE